MNNKSCCKCKEVKSLTEFHFKKTENRYNSWCKECVYTLQKERWVNRKKKAISLFGGKCSICGYQKNYAALHFHHRIPSEKEFDWSVMKLQKWAKVIQELKKCCLVCSNCHAEIHWPEADISNSKTDNNFLNLEISPTGKCPGCETDVYGTIYCSVNCSSFSRRKVKRPNRNDLKTMLETSNYSAIARKYGVSDNTIRKWVKNYDLI